MRRIVISTIFALVFLSDVFAQPGIQGGTIMIPQSAGGKYIVKPLPPGFRDFIDVYNEPLQPARFGIFCREWEKVISVQMRSEKWGWSVTRSIGVVNDLNAGIKCEYFTTLAVTPIGYAVRGDPEGVKVLIVKWITPRREVVYSGAYKFGFTN